MGGMLRHKITRAAARICSRFGASERVAFAANLTSSALHRLRPFLGDVKTVVDVGASDGRWAAEAHAFMPAADFLLIEAQAAHAASLKRFCKRNPWAQQTIVAASDQNGYVYFNGAELFGGQALTSDTLSDSEKVPARTVDSLVNDYKLLPPFCLKLDTHGYEVPILTGAQNALRLCNLVVIEVYNFRLMPSSLMFSEMVMFMQERGFRVADMSEPLWRPSDKALWQFDLFFLPSNHRIFGTNTYR